MVRGIGGVVVWVNGRPFAMFALGLLLIPCFSRPSPHSAGKNVFAAR